MKSILYKIKLMLPEMFKDRLRVFTPSWLITQLKYNEVHIISFPKCGRSWLKLLICDLVYNQYKEVSRINDVSTELLYKIDKGIPRIIFSHDDNPMYKSPKELEAGKGLYSRTKVVFLVRDPRDVLVSWYFEYTNRVSGDSKNEKIKHDRPSDFITNEVGGLKSIVAFYNLWIEKQNIPREFLIVKYEDLRGDTIGELGRLIDFMGFSQLIDNQAIEKAVVNNTFKKTQEREKKGDISLGKVGNEFGAEQIENAAFLKARKGKVGGYTDYFDEDQIKFINDYLSANLNPLFGY